MTVNQSQATMPLGTPTGLLLIIFVTSTGGNSLKYWELVQDLITTVVIDSKRNSQNWKLIPLGINFHSIVAINLFNHF